jgi:hypothetical protein
LSRGATFCASIPPAMIARRLNSCARLSARSISLWVLAYMITGISRAITGWSAASDGSKAGRRMPAGDRLYITCASR